MAITATIALSASSVKSNQVVTATCTVSNSGGAPVNVTSIAPLFTPSGATNQSVASGVGVPPTGAGLPTAVPASGSTPFSWPVVGFAPTSPAGGQYSGTAGQYQYSVGATVYTSDGAVTAATPATLTVANPSLT